MGILEIIACVVGVILFVAFIAFIMFILISMVQSMSDELESNNEKDSTGKSSQDKEASVKDSSDLLLFYNPYDPNNLI